jgi:hypothetical protein
MAHVDLPSGSKYVALNHARYYSCRFTVSA